MLLHVYTTDSKLLTLADLGGDAGLMPEKVFDMSISDDKVKVARFVTGWLRKHGRENIKGIPLLTVADWIMESIGRTGGHTEVAGLDGHGMVIVDANMSMGLNDLASAELDTAANRAAKVDAMTTYVDEGVRNRASAQLEYTGQRLIES